MSKKVFNLLVLLAAVSSLAMVSGTDAWAAGGRVPLYAAGTIGNSGSYYLTQNITGNITVGASNVTIDLNGLTVNGNLALGDGMAAYTNVRVYNGKVQGPITGVNTSYLKLDNLQAVSIMLDAGCKHAIIERNNVDGIDLQGNYSVVAHNTTKMITMRNIGHEVVFNSVNGSTATGIQMVMCAGCKIANNVVNSAGGIGIEVMAGNGNTIDNNTVAYNTSTGIVISSWYNKVTQNQVSGNSGYGIQIQGQDNEVTHNTVSMNILGGVFILDGYYNTVSYNTASQNGTGSGINMTPGSMYNVFDWNVANGNGAWGINIVGMMGNIASHNRTANNTTGGLNCNPPNINVFYDSGALPPVNPTNF